MKVLRYTVLCALLMPSAAHAAGLPIASKYSGKAGAVAAGVRITALRDGASTALARRAHGRVLRRANIDGRWTVPAATLDGETTGLSADGSTLVLVRPTRSYPSTRTRLAVVDADTLTVRRRVSLPGFFTVDAVSPDGRSAYLVQYASSNDFLDYRVRELDTQHGVLTRGAVVDPREPEEQMGGMPFTRATSPDGRWVYTLYGGGEETFIHALDTVGRTAACIDLAMIAPSSDLSRARLVVSPGGETVRVRDKGHLVATVDADTFAVRDADGVLAVEHDEDEAEPAVPATPQTAPAAPAASDDGGGFPWVWVLLAGGACAAGVLIVRRRDHPPGDPADITIKASN